MKLAAAIAGLALLAFGPAAVGDSAAEIDRLVAGPAASEGVAFEILTFEDGSWRWAAPMLRRAINRLRQRNPGLEVVLISHGSELFELALPTPAIAAADYRQLEQLHAEGLRLHVDGAYAQWKHLVAADFPAFVDLVPSAETTLEDYRALGFAVIRLEPPIALD